MISVSEPFLGKEELKNIIDCVKSGWISSKGDYIKRFEAEFAGFCNLRYGVSTTSGTTALHLALISLGLKKGDEVIIPVFTMVATAFAVLYTGARPVFIDCENRTWNIDTSKIGEAITPKTKAIIPVHIYGHPVDMKPVLKLADKHNLFVVEDAAEAHGAEYNGKRCGSLGDVGCFSFYANKIITTGEGGMVVTNDKKLAEKARLLKDFAHSPKKRFLHTQLAYNYKMTNMQAAIGMAQLRKIDMLLERKRKIAALYHRYLKDIEGLRLPIEENWAKSVYWMYGVLIKDDFGISRDNLKAQLLKEGVETRDFFVPMNRQPAIKKLASADKKRKYPVADYISRRGLYLPTGLTLREADILYICDKLRKIQKRVLRRWL